VIARRELTGEEGRPGGLDQEQFFDNRAGELLFPGEIGEGSAKGVEDLACFQSTVEKGVGKVRAGLT
jgi:hypothetical protein